MQKKYLLLLIGLVSIYILLAINVPVNPATVERYNLTPIQAQLLILTITVPYVLIWVAAFYGFAKFKEYASHILGTPDGKPLDRLATGLMILAVGFPVSSIVSSTLNLATRNNPSILPVTSSIRNYVGVAIAALAFYFIYKGAFLLAQTTKKKFLPYGTPMLQLLFLVFSAWYLYSVLNAPNLNMATAETSRQIYYLPTWIILATVSIPYLAAWYFGLVATQLVNFYQQHVPGILYKRALRFLSYGLTGVVIASMAQQLLTLTSGTLLLAPLPTILAIVYVLLFIISIGYLLIALGAKKLKKIEEV